MEKTRCAHSPFKTVLLLYLSFDDMAEERYDRGCGDETRRQLRFDAPFHHVILFDMQENNALLCTISMLIIENQCPSRALVEGESNDHMFLQMLVNKAPPYRSVQYYLLKLVGITLIH